MKKKVTKAATEAIPAKPAAEADWEEYSGYFRDSDGYLWEVAWNTHFWIE